MPHDSTSCWGWLVRGLAGMMNMMEREACEGVYPSPHYYEELDRIQRRLNYLIKILDSKVPR